jgi:hypothetical protein
MSNSAVQFTDDEERAQQPGPQRRALVFQRVGWAVFALIIVAALAGLLGPGPLSWTSATTPAGLVEVEYSRFVRHVADTSVELRVQPDPAQPSTARVWISTAYLSALNVQQVTPQPDTWTAMGDGVELTFPAAAGPDPVTVQLEIRPDDLWLVRGAVGAPGQEPVEFWQFVYP